MPAIILPFERTEKQASPEAKRTKLELDADIARSSEIFSRKVDYNLRSTSGIGYDYITRLLEGLFKSIICSIHQYSNSDFILRIEFEITRLNVFECRRLLKIIDEYLQSPIVCESKDAYFFMHVRNKVFQHYEGF